jgi:uncharacterized protein YbcI
VSDPVLPERRGEAASRISTRIVSTFKEYMGRGPTRARTIIRDDLVMCLLEDYLTKGERSLATDGKEQLVHQLRAEVQGTMRQALCAVVEEELGRRVVAFMSANHLNPDYMAEIFVLDAAATGEPSFDGARLHSLGDPER